jgi:hypothetical protein
MKFLSALLPLLFFFSFSSTPLTAQSDGVVEKAEVFKISPKMVLGNLISYSFYIQNKHDNPIDGLRWTAEFYDNFGELVDTKEDSFNASSPDDAIPSGSAKSFLKLCKYKGATAVKIKVTKVHLSK